MKNRPVGAELFHADGQTDMTKLTVAVRNSVNAPEGACLKCMNLSYKRCLRAESPERGGNRRQETICVKELHAVYV